MTNGPAAIQGLLSTNWYSALVWNPKRISSETKKVTTVTARATFRSTPLLSLGMNRSSRTPSIGRNVVRLSTLLMNSCSFIQSANDWLFEDVVTQDNNYTNRHRGGVIMDVARLHEAEHT